MAKGGGEVRKSRSLVIVVPLINPAICDMWDKGLFITLFPIRRSNETDTDGMKFSKRSAPPTPYRVITEELLNTYGKT